MLTRTLRGDKFIYADQPEGDAVECEVWYSKGGANYFSGGSDRRGVYVSFRNVKIERRDGIVTRSFVLFGSGVKHFALPLERKSDKQLQRVADLVSPYVVELVKTYRRDPNEASRELFTLLQPLKPKQEEVIA
jgi:hypothetical protein